MRDCTVEKVAIDALNAGSDYLLLAAIDGQLERVVDAICRAVETGGLAEKRLYQQVQKFGLSQKSIEFNAYAKLLSLGEELNS